MKRRIFYNSYYFHFYIDSFQITFVSVVCLVELLKGSEPIRKCVGGSLLLFVIMEGRERC
jgi:hypothetical protein